MIESLAFLFHSASLSSCYLYDQASRAIRTYRVEDLLHLNPSCLATACLTWRLLINHCDGIIEGRLSM